MTTKRNREYFAQERTASKVGSKLVHQTLFEFGGLDFESKWGRMYEKLNKRNRLRVDRRIQRAEYEYYIKPQFTDPNGREWTAHDMDRAMGMGM